MKEAIIIANGRFPKSQRVLEILKCAEYIICCDGAIRKLDSHNISPDIIIGDMDSVPTPLLIKYKNKILKVPEQDTNDLSKSFKYAIGQGFEKITILGATGKREDHTLGNISLLYSYNRIVPTQIVSDYGIWSSCKETTEFDTYIGQQVSIFSNKPETKVYSENLKYPLNGMLLDELWKGTLNESIGNTFKIIFDKGELIVFRCFE